jgi:hypothetical protein
MATKIADLMARLLRLSVTKWVISLSSEKFSTLPPVMCAIDLKVSISARPVLYTVCIVAGNIKIILLSLNFLCNATLNG